MKKHNIQLESFILKGKFKIKIENDEIHIPAKETSLGKSRHLAYVPGKFKLPFRIDMTVKANFINIRPSQLSLYIGKGRVYFNGGHTNSTDILTITKSSVFGDNELANTVYYNGIPQNEYVNISLIFGSKMMWITVDDTYCFSSNKMPYIKLLQNNSVPEEFKNGVSFSICSGTHTKLAIKSLTVIEYENDEPAIPAEIANVPELSQFELFVRGLPPKVHDEVFKTDEFLLKDMKSSLKFKRVIDKYGHLMYKSPSGFQYQIREFGAHELHEINWVQSSDKSDRTNEILKKLEETSPEFAEKIFSKLKICEPHARECKRRTIVKLKGKSRQVCSSTIKFRLLPSEFKDMRKVIVAANEILKVK